MTGQCNRRLDGDLWVLLPAVCGAFAGCRQVCMGTGFCGAPWLLNQHQECFELTVPQGIYFGVPRETSCGLVRVYGD